MIKLILSFILTMFIGSHCVNAENLNLSTTTVKTLDGKSIKLAEIIGTKPVYLKFWATWCIPCREQMPHLQHSYDQFGNKIVILAVNLDINDSQDAVKITQQEFQLSVPIVIDKGQVLSQAFDLNATPYHVLISKDGKIIHTGHDVTKELDDRLKLLAENQIGNIQEVALNKAGGHKLNLVDTNPTVVFFTSAWCDWYLEKSRPHMSNTCVAAQKKINTLFAKYSSLNWQGVLTRLWTGEKELNEYKKKFNVAFAMSVDTANTHFFNYQVDTFPTLIAFKDGKEIFRTDEFSDTKHIQDQLESLTTAQAK